MNNEIFQHIFDILYPVLPKEWEEMILYVAYTTGSYSMKFYTKNKDGVYTDCFSQGINKVRIIKVFMEIDKRLKEQRKQLCDKDIWSVMTMIVKADGSMKTDFEYSDISDSMIEYETEWKEKYIK